MGNGWSLSFKGRCAVLFCAEIFFFAEPADNCIELFRASAFFKNGSFYREVFLVYQALYRKWRPRTFDDVVGQGHITETLKRQVQSGRMSHAYLFTGTRGTGKTTCAKLLARAVNCRNLTDGNPCNSCPACLGIENGSVLDVLELDAASNNKVDDIRAILDEAVYTPATVRKRVYIVDEVHMLSTQAFNALLQILEEPPAHLMFILATTEIHKVPATIKSRCQQFSFKRIHAEEIAARLGYVAEQEGIDLTAEGAELIARLADGGMRDALSLLDQCVGSGGTVDQERVFAALGLAGNLLTAALLDCVADGDTAGALERLARLYAGGKEMSALAGEMSSLVRDLLVRKTAPQSGPALMTGGFDEATMRRLSGRFDIPRLVQMLTALQKTASELNRSVSRRTDMELCLVMLCDPTLDESVAGLSARLSRLEQGGAAVRQQAPVKVQPVEEPPAVQKPAAEPPKAKPQPVQMPEPQPEPKPTPKPPVAATPVGSSAAGWPGWTTVREALKGALPVSDYSFLGNPAMCEGRCDGTTVTLWASLDFVRDILDKPAITGAVAKVVQGIMGAPVRVVVQTGTAPAEQIVPVAAPPVAGEEDALETFLSGSLGNVIVE